MIKTTQPALHGEQHLPYGSDPIPGVGPGLGGGDTLDSIIAGHDPAGFWKLNESSGTVAADSSGNGLDLSVDLSGLAPTWGQPAGPPGELTADFETGTGGLGGTAGRVARTWAALTGDFTAGLFINLNSLSTTQVFGQGNPGRSGGSGWMLSVLSGVGPRFEVRNSGTYTVTMNADNPLAVSTWAMVAAVHDGSSWRLNINGADQSATSTGSYTPISTALWIGHDGGLGGNAVTVPQFVGSYAFLFPVALSGSELLEMYENADATGFLEEGLVLTSNGFGASSWEEPTIRVTSPAGRYDELTLGTGLTGTDNADGSITIDATGGGGGDPSTDTLVWMPLTTVTGGVPDLVWDGTDNLIPTLTPV